MKGELFTYTNILIVILGFFILGGLADLRIEQTENIKKQMAEMKKTIIEKLDKKHKSDKRFYNEIKDLIVFDELKEVRKSKKNK